MTSTSFTRPATESAPTPVVAKPTRQKQATLEPSLLKAQRGVTARAPRWGQICPGLAPCFARICAKQTASPAPCFRQICQKQTAAHADAQRLRLALLAIVAGGLLAAFVVLAEPYPNLLWQMCHNRTVVAVTIANAEVGR